MTKEQLLQKIADLPQNPSRVTGKINAIDLKEILTDLVNLIPGAETQTTVEPMFTQANSARLACSLRLLRDDYTGPCIKVRRDSDDLEKDIYFSGTAVNSPLDTEDLLLFVGSGDAYIVTWYDQSVNAYHLGQDNLTQQPRIVIGGALVTEGGKPAIDYNTDYLFNTTAQTFGDTDLYCALVIKV